MIKMFEFFRFAPFFKVFAYIFFRKFFKLFINEFEINNKLCVFGKLINKTLQDHTNLECKCAKKTQSISRNFLKVKTIVLPISIILRLISSEIQKKVKFKPPTYTFYRSKFIKISVFLVNIIGTIF